MRALCCLWWRRRWRIWRSEMGGASPLSLTKTSMRSLTECLFAWLDGFFSPGMMAPWNVALKCNPSPSAGQSTRKIPENARPSTNLLMQHSNDCNFIGNVSLRYLNGLSFVLIVMLSRSTDILTCPAIVIAQKHTKYV